MFGWLDDSKQVHVQLSSTILGANLSTCTNELNNGGVGQVGHVWSHDQG